ncbi:MAG: hypothetical protein GY943_36465, partial [Chloroflexi bacterium]|nr:hypothetical protein [Chloroflexota bacterium]
MRKFIKAVLLILITSLFAGCSVIEPRIQMVRDSGISGLYLALGSLLILLLLIVLIIAVYYAERRWQILQLIRPSRYLSKIPGMREATVLKRGADTTLQQGQRAKRYLPGYESELSSGTLKPGQAVRPSQASIGGEKANQRKNQKGFAALLPA